jgi:hypothetical protein
MSWSVDRNVLRWYEQPIKRNEVTVSRSRTVDCRDNLYEYGEADLELFNLQIALGTIRMILFNGHFLNCD